MKRLLSTLVMLALLSFVVPADVSAQRCGSLRHRHSNRTHTHRSCVGDRHKHGRSFWQKHRDKDDRGRRGAGALIAASRRGKGAAIGALAAAVARPSTLLIRNAAAPRATERGTRRQRTDKAEGGIIKLRALRRSCA